jgi:hypothetical protein
MSYVKSELYSHILGKKFDIQIVKLDNKCLFTSIPKLNDKELPMKEGDTFSISYYFGEFAYLFKAVFIKKEAIFYLFETIHVEIISNFRSEQRENVEIDAVFWFANKMNAAKILDVSPNGLRIETKTEITREFVEIYYEEDSNIKKVKGEIKWKKNSEDQQFQYGIQLVKNKKN